MVASTATNRLEPEALRATVRHCLGCPYTHFMIDSGVTQRRRTSIVWRHFCLILHEFPQLKERRRGDFSRGSRAFLHFHEDAGDVYVGVRLDSEFERICPIRLSDTYRWHRHSSAPLGRVP
jgi:hypothetical protein